MPAYQAKLGAADPSWALATLSNGTENITSVTVTPTTEPNGMWDFIVDSLAINQSAVPSLIWNNTGGGSPSNGTTWDTTDNNWNTGSATTTYQQGNAVTFNDNNNGHYAVTLSTQMSPAATVFDNSSGSYTVSGAGGISGSGSLAADGTSTVTLSTVNHYTGVTAVAAGELVIGAAGALPGGSVAITGGEQRVWRWVC
jgi:autotransporter-associated beta strand protein